MTWAACFYVLAAAGLATLARWALSPWLDADNVDLTGDEARSGTED